MTEGLIIFQRDRFSISRESLSTGPSLPGIALNGTVSPEDCSQGNYSQRTVSPTLNEQKNTALRNIEVPRAVFSFMLIYSRLVRESYAMKKQSLITKSIHDNSSILGGYLVNIFCVFKFQTNAAVGDAPAESPVNRRALIGISAALSVQD